ncbi:MAG: hypothetical protein JWO02_1356 [Solirubrobacterales bacterium]|nr:hypothetical protein [Solirubrobacterales bacterium]
MRPVHALGVVALAAVWGLVSLGLAVFGTALAFVLLYALMDALGPGRAALNTYLVPVFALAYGSVFLDEQVGAEALAGLALVLAGVAVAGTRRPEPAVPVQSDRTVTESCPV